MYPTVRDGLVALVVGISTFFAADAINPDVVEKIAPVPAERSFCPTGWTDTSSRDEHQIVLSCTRDKWLVILNPGGGFNYALPLDTPGAQFVTDPRAVPGW